MKRLLILIVPLMVGCCQTNPKEEEFNLNQEHIVMATIWYQHSPEAQALYYQGFNLAKQRVCEIKTQVGKKPFAVVVDIDETMVNNSLFQGQSIEAGKDYSSEFWAEWVALAKASALPGAVEFSRVCDSLGIEIFYISNRKEVELERTMHNLDSLGFAFVRAENFLLKTTTSGKEERRMKVAEKYEIVLLLGDNLNDFSDVFEQRNDNWGSDVVGRYKKEFGKRFIVLPNPMYGDWEKNIYGKEWITDDKVKFRKRRAAISTY